MGDVEQPVRSSLQFGRVRSQRSSSIDSDRGTELFFAHQELKSTLLQMQTLEHRLAALELKEKQMTQKAEESFRRQKHREEVQKKHRDELEMKARWKSTLQQSLEARRAKFLEQREAHKATLNEFYSKALDSNKRRAIDLKSTLNTELNKTKEILNQEALNIRQRSQQIAEANRNQVRNRQLKSKSFLESLKTSFDQKLESKVQERERVISKIALMENREKELLDRLKVTQQRISSMEAK